MSNIFVLVVVLAMFSLVFKIFLIYFFLLKTKSTRSLRDNKTCTSYGKVCSEMHREYSRYKSAEIEMIIFFVYLFLFFLVSRRVKN